mmetsp:Transcript_8872/g.22313  ORF Transcript_8872/g.22313 Transcript_8872/m.22313 type:complete len:488 (+) Transcript_8872:179-1642(+)|eukprot:CAMPEP_0177645610 /NCGR_PEP_ID=MMETSP0447-20121125/9340_1 /TAXON_ID=0 /ORGANISM="Stygamoeba regulata, Strain BSH-02190019" /LENGTH=487 /DNA_ID=CAMNT_0019148103 /DNA_START=199 /DNA_END=1662 /DNA_ORIENTATION=-
MLRTLFLALALCCALARADVDLPGYTGPALGLRTGYIDIEGGKHVFYYLFASRSRPATDPLVMWFQGGPGCSSGPGLFQENGPIVPTPEGGLAPRDVSWVNIANMVFVDQPAGVGFSYQDAAGPVHTNDTQAATDNHSFIDRFLEKYPEFSGRDLWLTGESYAGMYVPSVVQRIVHAPSSAAARQLKGFAVGNPVFQCESNDQADEYVNIAYWHGLAPFSLYSLWQSQKCRGSDSAECQDIFNTIMGSIGGMDQPVMRRSMRAPAPEITSHEKKERFQPINPDHVFYDFCTGNGSLVIGLDDPKSSSCKHINTGDLLDVYLNRADVQAALGVRPVRWGACSGSDRLDYNTQGGSLVPVYRDIFATNPSLRVLVYSGDLDVFTVPSWGTQVCLDELKDVVKMTKRWHQWTVNGATAGYYEVYDRYTYATVRGGGHEVPQFEPFTAFHLFSRFLNNQSLGEFTEDNPPVQSPASSAQSRILRKLSSTHH